MILSVFHTVVDLLTVVLALPKRMLASFSVDEILPQRLSNFHENRFNWFVTLSNFSEFDPHRALDESGIIKEESNIR